MVRLLMLGLACGWASVATAGFAKWPYLQNLTDRSVVVRFETAQPQPGGVQYGLTAGYSREIMRPDPDTLHELLLDGLEPDTVYHYRAVSGPDTSADACFRTPPQFGRTFRLCAYGDTHGDSSTHHAVLGRMELVAPRPGLLLHCGDLTGTGSLGQYRTFFNIERGLLSGVPVFPVLGNRDDDSIGNWHRFFCLPGNERWYALRHGNSAFYCLDNYSDYTPGSEQYDWFLAELRADSASPEIRHRFVLIHEPPYSTNNAFAGNAATRQHLCPLFERFGVRIVLSGHVHAYERSLLRGVNYVTTGGGSASLSTSWGAAQPWTVYREAAFHFTLIDVRGDTVVSRALKPTGAVFDSFALPSPPTGAAEPHVKTATLPLSARPTLGPTEFTFALASKGRVRLAMYDPAGRLLSVLFEGMLTAGIHRVRPKARLAPAGVCCVVLEAPAGLTSLTVVLGP